MQVPRHPPPTREIWAEWTKLWPIVWRQPDFGPLALRPDAAVMDPAAIRSMQEWMCRAWQLGLDAKAAGQAFNAAIIVDHVRGTHLWGPPLKSALQKLYAAGLMFVRARVRHENSLGLPLALNASAAGRDFNAAIFVDFVRGACLYEPPLKTALQQLFAAG